MAKVKKAVKKTTVKSQSKALKPKIHKAVLKGKAKTDVVKVPKLSIPKAPYKKSEFLTTLSTQTEVSKKDVAKVLEAIQSIVALHLVKNGPGQFIYPGLFKMTAKTKPATKARKGRNPFTGEDMMFKAKPAQRVVKVRLLKKFKSGLE